MLLSSRSFPVGPTNPKSRLRTNPSGFRFSRLHLRSFSPRAGAGGAGGFILGDAEPVGSSSSRFLGWEGTPGPAAAPLCCRIPQEFCRNGISGGVSRCFPRSHTGMGHGAARAERPEWFSLRKSWECVPGISLELLFPSRELRPPSPGFLQPWEFPPLPPLGLGRSLRIPSIWDTRRSQNP